MASVIPATISRPARRRRWWKAVLAVILLGAALILIDRLVGRQQERVLEERKAAQARLEKMAWFYLRADLEDITLTPDNKYKVTVWIENLFPEYDFYLMVPTLRGFIQVGPQWQEVKTVEATTDPGLREGTVINIKDKVRVSWLLDIQAKDYYELLPGYMHVQVNNNMFVSPQAEPTEGEAIVERNDYYYVHLKPIGADDEYIRRVNNFPAGAPLYIPMPPH